MIPHYGGDGNLVVDAHVVTQRLPWRHPSIILDVYSKGDGKKNAAERSSRLSSIMHALSLWTATVRLRKLDWRCLLSTWLETAPVGAADRTRMREATEPELIQW